MAGLEFRAVGGLAAGDFNGDGRVGIGDLIALVSAGLYGSGSYRL